MSHCSVALRTQVETNQVAESCRAVEATGKPVKLSGAGKTIFASIFPLRRRDVYEGRHRRRWQAHAWLQRTVYPPSVRPLTQKPYTRTTKWAWDGTIFLSTSPAHRAENARRLSRPHRMAAQRGQHLSCFRDSLFADELAHNAKKDPVQYLLDLIGPARNRRARSQGDEAEDAKAISAHTARCGAWSRSQLRNRGGARVPWAKAAAWGSHATAAS